MGKGHERAAEIHGCFANLPKMVFSAAQGGLGRATTGTLVRCLGARLQGTRGTEGHPESTGVLELASLSHTGVDGCMPSDLAGFKWICFSVAIMCFFACLGNEFKLVVR